MITLDKISKNIKKQEEIEGLTEDLKLVKLFLSKIKSASQWQAFIKTKFHKYGQYSYQSYVFYYCSDELLALLNVRKETHEVHIN